MRHGWRRWPLAGRMLLLAAALLPGNRATAAEPLRSQAEQHYEQEVRPLLTTYCGACHGADKHKGDVDFSHLAKGSVALAQRDLWRTAADQLASREMPPEQEKKQPSAEERNRLLAWMGSLKRLDPPDPGHNAIRRLSRSEYINTLRDLLGVELKVGDDLPHEASGSDVAISPLLMERYLLAADAALDQIVIDDQLSRQWMAGQLTALIADKTQTPTNDGQNRVFSGPGELSTTLALPANATYTIKVKAGAEQAGKEPARLAVRCDGQVVDEIKVVATSRNPATYTCKVKLAGGRTRLAIAFMNPFSEPAAEPAKPPGAKPPAGGPVVRPPPSEPAKPRVRSVTIESVEISGPPAAPLTPAHKRIFISNPGPTLARRDAARAIVEPFAFRAFRRPPTAQEIERLLTVFTLADRQDEVFSSAVKLMLKAVLVSPQFLYRTPEDRPTPGADIIAVGDFELASRLSYFMWSTMPDEELFAAARTGTLHQPAVLAAQARRLIRDPRSRALIDNFATPWLGLDQLAQVVVDDKKFPQFTTELRQAMYEEGAMLVETIMREDRSLLELIACDYTFVNPPLAKLYGMTEIKGGKWQKVTLSDANRGGVMTLPGVLTVTSMSTRTSPVKRGKWVLEQLLGSAPPPPPANIAALEKQDTPENAGLTLRQKTERHRSDPACAACHRSMDQIGFGLENFDAIGRWRERDDTGVAVDASGELPGRQRFTSPAELKQILLAHRDDFTCVLAGRLLGYALGRSMAGYDEVVVEDLAAAVAKDGYRFDTLLVGIVTSYPFLNARNPGR